MFDSNGPDVRIRGTASQVAEKYEALAKDAAGAGDLILAESYLQHAEHYIRVMSAWSDDRPASHQQSQTAADSDDVEDSAEEETERFSSKKSTASPRKPAQQDDLGLPSSLFGADARDGVDA
ncbi:MAG: DUF4167 domain-containing protein [Alphaproteobacteria bacterium]|nr:DUF4167 domain-containing protein [Alphaproteobacteria bacterium]MCD8519964.1 DUF4167 domain-containing protein [Alphaproteobacteria bacterium]MCD8571539.1 DUF4167 domain-containing protein [Alphaproteobacteria bacterium]